MSLPKIYLVVYHVGHMLCDQKPSDTKGMAISFHRYRFFIVTMDTPPQIDKMVMISSDTTQGKDAPTRGFLVLCG